MMRVAVGGGERVLGFEIVEVEGFGLEEAALLLEVGLGHVGAWDYGSTSRKKGGGDAYGLASRRG